MTDTAADPTPLPDAEPEKPIMFGYLLSFAFMTHEDEEGNLVPACTLWFQTGASVVTRTMRLNVASTLISQALREQVFALGTNESPFVGLAQ